MCSQHSKKQALFIKIKELDNSKQIFYCDECLMSNKNNQLSNFILVSQITEARIAYISDKWPPLDDIQIVEDIQKILESSQTETIVQKIQKFFEKFQREIIDLIKGIEKNILKDINANSLPLSQEQISIKVQEISKIKEFQQLLINQNTDNQQKEEQVFQFVQKSQREKAQNTNILQELINKNNRINQSFDFSQPNQVKENIFEQINSICFFSQQNEKLISKSQTNQTNSEDILPKLELIASKNQNCQMKNIYLQKLENNSIMVDSPFGEGNNGYFYSNFILDRNKKYIFRVKFHRNQSEGEGFLIGLVKEQNKDSNNDLMSCWFLYSKLSKCNGLVASNSAINKKVKGDLKDDIDSVELRVCIKDKILDIFDYPNYSSQYSLEERYKDLYFQEDNDFRLQIYVQRVIKVTLFHASTCENFDE